MELTLSEWEHRSGGRQAPKKLLSREGRGEERLGPEA